MKKYVLILLALSPMAWGAESVPDDPKHHYYRVCLDIRGLPGLDGDPIEVRGKIQDKTVALLMAEAQNLVASKGFNSADGFFMLRLEQNKKQDIKQANIDEMVRLNLGANDCEPPARPPLGTINIVWRPYG